ncbi:MAG: LPS-assembly protein LptD [Pseudomonadales bacterium]
MPEKSRHTVKFTLLTALALSGPWQSATAETAANRWSCKAGPDGGWQCSAAGSPDGLGTRYIQAERKELEKAVATQPAAQISSPTQRLDWVPKSALTSEQRAETPGYCSGLYIEPDYVDASLLDVDPSTQPMKGAAQSSQTDENGITTLRGDVVIKQGYRQVESEEAVLDRESGTANFTSRARYREPGFLLIGEQTHVDLNSKEVNISDAEFVAHEAHIRGTAETLVRGSDGVVRVNKGSVTYCAPGANTWAVVGSELKIDQQAGVGTVKHARLHVKDVPIMYVPYMSFPLGDERKSGFLTPDIGTSDGIDIATPYYWNIAPNYDATLTPRYIGDRGVMGEAQFRYLHNNNQGELGAAYLPGDDDFMNEDRWLGAIDHEGTLFNTINTRVDATSVSDDDYFSDLGTDLHATSQTHLLRLAEARYNGQYWDITARTQGYQTIDSEILDADKPYDRLPQLIINGLYPHDASGFEFGLFTEYTRFDRDNSGLTGLDRAVGDRTRVEPSISWLFETPYAYIKPKATYRYARYQLDDLASGLNDSPDLSVPVYSIDSGLFFERDTSWFSTPLTQTFEPRLFYLKVPEEKNQLEIPDFDSGELDFSYNQLFRENRFVGGDRVGDADQVSLGLTSRFIETDGFERARASIGQIYYNEDRRVTLDGAPVRTDMTSESPLAAELMFALKSGWRIQGDIEWDPDIERTNQSSLYLRYHGDNSHLFNIGYRRRNDDRQRLEQTDLSFVWPVADQWSLISRWNHDLINDRVVEAFAGVEYQSCCWAVRLVGRHWINNDDITDSEGIEEKDAIYIQFIFKGLGDIGDSIESLFSDSIPGYQEP